MGPRILAAVDFDIAADRVLVEAAKLARSLDGSIVLLHAVPPPMVAADVPVVPEDPTPLAREKLERLADGLRYAGIAVDARVRVAAPGPAILGEADAIDPAMIVIGTHGRRGLVRLVTGSVAAYVIRRSSRPVVVVPCDLRRLPPRAAA